MHKPKNCKEASYIAMVLNKQKNFIKFIKLPISKDKNSKYLRFYNLLNYLESKSFRRARLQYGPPKCFLIIIIITITTIRNKAHLPHIITKLEIQEKK